MRARLDGKSALITAAGQGIGRAIAVAFAREGAHVIATDVDPDKLAGLDADGIANTAELNVRDTDAVDDLADDTGPVDILVNAAGFVHNGSVLECDEEQWDFSFDLNVKSMHRTISAFVPLMLDNRGGTIINIASLASSIKGVPNRYVYGASKAAVIGLTKAIAIDFIKRNIRCNAICPGTILSPSLEQRIIELGANVGSVEKARAMFVDRQPMGRLGTSEEIASLAVYLGSDESAFVTGQAFIIDGGMAI